jgi:hypothetical protein
MLGTKLNIPDTAAGRMTELVSKAERKEKDTDVLMWVSTAKDKPSGELKVQLRGVGTTRFFQKARNAFLARSAASKENIENLFMQRGMTPGEASAAAANVNKIGKHYSAKSVNEALQNFDNARRESVGEKIVESPETKASIITNDAIDGSQASIELTLSRLKDYLPDYDPRTKDKL